MALDLERRFDATRMTALEIYPAIWHGASRGEDSWRWLLDRFERIRVFVKRAAYAGDGLVMDIS